MSNEIATYSMILSKLSLGKSGTECPTKTQILAINSLIVINNASTYGANECVKIDDIRKKAETWNYYLTVSPTSMSFGAGGGSKQFTYSSYKRKVLDGVEQSGDTNVSLKSTTISGTGFSLSGTTVSASANEGTSNRTGTVTITQNESNKTATISLSQSGDTISSYGEWTISVSANPTSVSSDGGTSRITASAKRTVYWASGDVTEETGNPALSTNLGSLSSASSPSTLTLGENTSTSNRTATIKATHGGKSATCTVTQSGATPSTTYTFSINPYKVNVGSSGGSGSVTISSYKTVGSSTYDVDYSIDSSTLPSWASFNKSTSTFTIQSTTSTTGRTAKVYFDQDESDKRDYAELTQTGYTPPADNYVFTITPNTYDAPYSSASFIPRTVSTKNGSNIGYSLTSGSTDWVVVDTTGKITVEILKNTTSSTRSTTLVFTQNESGKTQSIEITQSGYTPTYTFNVIPTNLGVDAIANTYSFTVNSSKTILNDDGSESSERIGWTGTDDADWIYLINASNRPNQIGTVTNETTLQRTAKITLTQDGTGIQAFVNVIQEAGVESNNELYIDSIHYDSVHLFGNGEVPHSGSQRYFLVSTGVPIHWKTSNGLAVNGGTVYAGDTISVYVSSNNSYTLLRTFALETGVQRVIV